MTLSVIESEQTATQVETKIEHVGRFTSFRRGLLHHSIASGNYLTSLLSPITGITPDMTRDVIAAERALGAAYLQQATARRSSKK